MTVGDIKYDPGCFDCRKDAGKPEAGLHEDNVCYPHLHLRFAAYEKKMTARVKVLEEALEEMCEVLTCRCDVAYKVRGLHSPDCLEWVGDIGRAALAGEEEKR